VACCTGCDGDKEVKSCPVCGKPVPPSLGYKPRKFCSRECCNASGKKQKPQYSECEFCGDIVQQSRRGPLKRFCSESCQKKQAKRRNQRPPRPPKVLPTAACCECGSQFVVDYKGKKLCSLACRSKYTAARNVKNAVTYTCLCCSKPFRKTRSGRNSGKYCSRECAFEARRLRLPCVAATRRIGTSLDGQLAVWFHSWGSGAEEPKNVGYRRGGNKHRCLLYGCHYEYVNERSIYERDGWECQLCGRPLKRSPSKNGRWSPTPDYPTIDHIVPLSRGPASPGHCPSNVQAACWECNSKKSDLDADSFAARKATSTY